MDDRALIVEVMARYTRNADARDGDSQALLFTEDCITEIFSNVGGRHVLTDGPLHGREPVTYATSHLLPKYDEGGWSHHFTTDHLVTIDGDRAQINAHFFVTAAHAKVRPVGGWPAGSSGLQGNVTVETTGYYVTDLVKTDHCWKICHHRIVNDLPWIAPELVG